MGNHGRRERGARPPRYNRSCSVSRIGILFRLSAPAAGALLGLVTGIIDSAFVEIRFAQGFMPAWESLATWLIVAWTWIATCSLAGLLFSAERLGRMRWLPLAFAGPGLMLLARAVPPLKDVTGWRAPVVIALWIAAVGTMAMLLTAVPLVRSRAGARWGAFGLASLGILGLIAADLRPSDWLAPESKEVASPQKPNVALIFLDATRYDDALGEGTSRMPSMARFAGRSLSFEDAWAPAPWTDPSHRAVLTGVSPWRRADGESPPSLPQRLRRRGYATAAVFSNVVLASFEAGFDEFTVSRGSPACSSGIGRLFWRSLSYGGPPAPVCSRMDAAEVTARSLRFVRRAQRPYFLAVNYLDAHDPYYVPRRCRDSSFRAATRNERMSVVTANGGGRRPSAVASRRLRDQYRAALRCMDASLGVLLDALEKEPNTIVAVVGDHGEHFGEHGMGGHGNSVYRQVLHVPLVLRVPGWTARRVSDAVSTVDLHPTLLQAVEPGRHSRNPVLLDATVRRPAVAHFSFTSGRRNAPRAGAFSAAADGFHLIVRDDGREELYRYADDTEELRPLDPAAVPAAEGLRATIRRERARQRGTSEFKALGYMQ